MLLIPLISHVFNVNWIITDDKTIELLNLLKTGAVAAYYNNGILVLPSDLKNNNFTIINMHF